MVKKSSILEKLKTRWMSGSSVRGSKSGRGNRLEADGNRLGSRLEQAPARLHDAPPEHLSGRKLSSREEALVKMGEGFQELNGLVRGVQSRVDDQGGRTAELAADIKALPALGRAQLDLLRRMADQLERQGETSDQLVSTLGVLPKMLSGVQEALAKAAATDLRTAETLDGFRQTMDRIEGSMGKMVESSQQQARATGELAQGHVAEQRRMVDAIREGREQEVQALVKSHENGVERMASATTERLDAMRKLQSQQADHLTKLVTTNGKWTQLIVILLSLTFFVLAGILAVLAF